MYFPSTAFWLFWLTFVNMNHNQLNIDGCFGAALQQKTQEKQQQQQPEQHASVPTTSATMEEVAEIYVQTGMKRSAIINSKSATAAAAGVEENPVDISVGTKALAATATTTTTPTTPATPIPAATPNNQDSVRNVRNSKTSENFALNFKENIAKLFANEAQYTKYGNTVATNNGSSGNLPHTPGRRHIIPEKLQYTKEISIKQGRLMGIIRNFHTSTGLRDVDQYLGLPYAEAPVGSRRFMPPGTPLPWKSLKIARHLPPVCPQKLPEISIQGSAKMSRGRYKHLTRLMPYLKHENEDCLYLNVYVPREDGLEQVHAYPVIVYIHGESFEWNSGNPYDGSILASYGQVIVVTVNYRLGVLGFMKPGLSEQTVANFGLLDQIAALAWIKENVASFGGDASSVTLMGHGTGAASVNYLMISPVASGLFHRAILMSGSAMSDWAASNHSLQLTMQIAHALSCPLNDDNEQMITCLRQQPYEDILKIPTSFPQFSTSLGPIVDGHVIPNQPYKVMGQYTEHFSRYDLLFGITESESYHALGALALEEGLRENERDNLLRFYMQSRFDIRPDLALAATLKKYNDMYNNPIKASNLEHRDVVLDILSDARVVGPLMQTGLFHADVNRRNYMYVFGHNSAAGPYASLPHSITGEELAFIFGAPLAPAGPFPNNYSTQEKLLSEAVMAYWTNFARTGNPKAPWKGTFINSHALEWDRYDTDWPEFNKRSQAYINIGIPPSIGYKYRQIYMNFWNKELPDELNQIALIQQQPFLQAQYPNSQFSHSGTSAIYPTRFGSEVITGHMSKFGTRDNGAEDPVRTLKLLLQEPYNNKPMVQVETAENMYNAPPTFGIAKHAEDEIFGMNTMPTNGAHANGASSTAIYGVSRSEVDGAGAGSNLADDKQDEEVAKSETTIQLLIGLIVVFIVLNVIIYSTFLLQKRKKASTMHRKLGGILSYDGATDDELKRSKHTTQNDGDESYILDMVRKSNTYEPVKTERSPINGFKITRQLSTSTVDTHTKVCEWMSVTGERKFCGTLTRLQSSPKASKKSSSPTFSSIRGSSGGGSFMQQPHKVSVAVDATPQARSNSVLCQEPIEVTKLKADGRNIIICQDVEVEDQELLTPQNSLDASRYSLMRQHSAATDTCDVELPQQLLIAHTHSRSDPVEMYYNKIYAADEKITSFMGDARRDELQDINVTSRDDVLAGLPESLSPEQQLSLIKRRNYPKVLPTTTERCTDSPPMTADLSTTYKRNSLPPNSFLPHFGGKQGPVPPPRTISTLGRKPSVGRRNSNNITTSPLMLAQDCTEEEEEPLITQNTLIVGPIVPKSKVGSGDASDSNEGIYSTLKRRERETARQHEDMKLNANANEVANCDSSATATDSMANEASNRQVRRPPALCLPPLAGGSSGTYQALGSRPNLAQEAAETQARVAAHHTEKVYAIEATRAVGIQTPITPTTPLSPTNFSSTPTTPATHPATHPATQPATSPLMTPTTPTDAKLGLGTGVIYAQPTKCSNKPNLTVGKSCIPRMMPATTTTTTITRPVPATEVAAAGAELAIPTNTAAHLCGRVTPTAATTMTTTTPSTACNPLFCNLAGTTPSATTRIPQLNRNPQQQLQQQQPQHNQDKTNVTKATTAITPTTTTNETIATSSATATGSALPVHANANTNTAANSNGSSDTQAANSSRVSTLSCASTSSATSSSSSSSSSFSSSSSSSSSSTNTVRTDLQQK